MRICCTYIQGFLVELHSFLCVALLSLNVSQVVKRVGMSGAQGESCIVAILSLLHLTLLLEGVGQVTIRIGEVGLKLNGPAVGVDGQVNQSTKTIVIQIQFTLFYNAANSHQ